MDNYTQKYLKYKEKYLALQKEYDQLIKMKAANMKGGNGNHASKMTSDNKITVMLFKADWCGHCVKFKPTWDKLSEIYNKKFNFITYDADKQRDKFIEYKVDAFPTVLVKNGSQTIPYDGDRSFDEMNNFLQHF